MSIASAVGRGFSNLVARLGGPRNVSENGFWFAPDDSKSELKQLLNVYRCSGIARRVIDCVASDMIRDGVQFGSSVESEQAAAIERAMKVMRIWDQLFGAARDARLMGGSIAVMIIDGQDVATPLNAVGKDSFIGLRVYDKRAIDEVKYDDAPIQTPISVKLDGGAIVDASRCLFFIGCDTPPKDATKPHVFGDSVLISTKGLLENLELASKSSAELISVSYLRVLKIAGFRDRLTGSDEQAQAAYLASMRTLQRIIGLTVTDAADSFETHSYTFGGISDIIETMQSMVSGATGIPVTKLFGQAPRGLNATGEADLRQYYDLILAEQERVLRSPLDRLFAVLTASLFGSPLDFDFTFRPLWQEPSSVKATTESTRATTILNAYTSGAIDEQIAARELQAIGKDGGAFATMTDEDVKRLEANVPMPPSADSVLSGPYLDEDGNLLGDDGGGANG